MTTFESLDKRDSLTLSIPWSPPGPTNLLCIYRPPIGWLWGSFRVNIPLSQNRHQRTHGCSRSNCMTLVDWSQFRWLWRPFMWFFSNCGWQKQLKTFKLFAFFGENCHLLAASFSTSLLCFFFCSNFFPVVALVSHSGLTSSLRRFVASSLHRTARGMQGVG